MLPSFKTGLGRLCLCGKATPFCTACTRLLLGEPTEYLPRLSYQFHGAEGTQNRGQVNGSE